MDGPMGSDEWALRASGTCKGEHFWVPFGHEVVPCGSAGTFVAIKERCESCFDKRVLIRLGK